MHKSWRPDQVGGLSIGQLINHSIYMFVVKAFHLAHSECDKPFYVVHTSILWMLFFWLNTVKFHGHNISLLDDLDMFVVSNSMQNYSSKYEFRWNLKFEECHIYEMHEIKCSTNIHVFISSYFIDWYRWYAVVNYTLFIYLSGAVHGGFQCVLCGRIFKKRRDVVRHLRTHTGEKPFVCQVCQRPFSLKFNLKKHMLVHMNFTWGQITVMWFMNVLWRPITHAFHMDVTCTQKMNTHTCTHELYVRPDNRNVIYERFVTSDYTYFFTWTLRVPRQWCEYSNRVVCEHFMSDKRFHFWFSMFFCTH